MGDSWEYHVALHMHGRLMNCDAVCAGKDLHKLSLPTHLNEPLTDLQRRAEAFEASELLDMVPSYSLRLHKRSFCSAVSFQPPGSGSHVQL